MFSLKANFYLLGIKYFFYSHKKTIICFNNLTLVKDSSFIHERKDIQYTKFNLNLCLDYYKMSIQDENGKYY